MEDAALSLPNPFLSADPPTAETAPASNDWNPEDAGVNDSCGGVERRHAKQAQPSFDGSPGNGSVATTVGLAPGPQETNHIHEIFHYARKLYDEDHRFVLDEGAFMEAIEPPPLFMQRVG